MRIRVEKLFTRLTIAVLCVLGLNKQVQANSTSSAIRLILCQTSGGTLEMCSQDFIKSCLSTKLSSTEQTGTEVGCLEELLEGWELVEEGFVDRGASNYHSEQQYNFKKYLSTWKIFDAAECRFQIVNLPKSQRILEAKYCQLSKQIMRIEFLVEDHLLSRSQTYTPNSVPEIEN